MNSGAIHDTLRANATCDSNVASLLVHLMRRVGLIVLLLALSVAELVIPPAQYSVLEHVDGPRITELRSEKSFTTVCRLMVDRLNASRPHQLTTTLTHAKVLIPYIRTPLATALIPSPSSKHRPHGLPPLPQRTFK